MLQILNPAGVDLNEQIPAPLYLSCPSVNSTGHVRIQCRVVQLIGSVGAVVDWNDGRPVDRLVGLSPLTVDFSRHLLPGKYLIRVDAHDFLLPTSSKLSVTFPVVITVSGAAKESPILFGPILPKDQGFPNASQWSFHSGSDVEIIASSLKMLLMTAKGERIMLPDYGTNLRSLLFEFSTPGLHNMCQQEIVEAVSKWEPRAALAYMGLTKADRAVVIECTFTSLLSQQQFSLNLNFAL